MPALHQFKILNFKFKISEGFTFGTKANDSRSEGFTFGTKANDSRSEGFTLVELLVVITIISVLSVTGFAVFTGISARTNDTRRKADIDAIAKAYEVKYVQNNSYPVGGLEGKDFAGGQFPKDPRGSQYFNVVASDGSGFKICASLNSNSSEICNSSSANCYCKTSSSSELNASTPLSNSTSSTSSLSGSELGWGANQSPSCDPNGTMAAGLVGYWKMDEAAGSTTALDSSSTKANGSYENGLTTITSTITDFKKAAEFNTSNSTNKPRIKISDNNTLDIGTGSKSWSFWYKTSNTNRQLLFRKSGGSNVGGVFCELDNGIIKCWIGNGMMSPNSYADSVTKNGSWHHLAYVFDRTAKEAYLYFDNSKKNTVKINNTIPSNIDTTEAVGIGWDGNISFVGQMDEFRIYNKALSAQDISTIYNNGLGCAIP